MIGIDELPRPRKWALTALVTSFIVTLGVAYQYYYLEEKAEYERAIQAYSLKTRGRTLDAKKLGHLAILALDRYGPTEVYRMEDDYRVLFGEAHE